MTVKELTLDGAENLAQTHYENFPVAPFFLPKQLREPIALIYTFARVADDIADEGDLTNGERLQKLAWMHQQLPDQINGISDNAFFQRLNSMIESHQLPCSLFHDLLSAFEQDVTKDTYENEESLLSYCQKSANPIGRLLLHLSKQDTKQNLIDSDKICTALQLINFLQDWHSDLTTRQRLYIPLNDMAALTLTQKDLLDKNASKKLQPLLKKQFIRAHDLLMSGAPLTQRLSGRLGLQIRLTLWGGWSVLKKLKNRDISSDRPTLNRYDWVQLGLYGILKKTPKNLCIQ